MPIPKHAWSALLTACLILTGAAASANPDNWRREWPDTDFSRTSVDDWSDILSGGPPRDGIPALSNPAFVVASTDTRIGDREPVVVLELDGARPRAYPLRYLIWHEIVNDTVGGMPVAITYCPLCNSFITFDRRVARGTLSFGVSGKLRASNLIMYDRETRSWWQQALGEAIVGDLTGTTLNTVPSWLEDWAGYRDRNPDGLVMAQPDYPRSYGMNPYRGYDGAARPFLYSGANPPFGIPPLMRVVRVGNRAWPMDRLAREGRITEAGVTINWAAGQASALDSGRIGKGRDVGNIRVRDGQGRDVVHDIMFAFAFDAFWPDGIWMRGP